MTRRRSDADDQQNLPQVHRSRPFLLVLRALEGQSAPADRECPDIQLVPLCPTFMPKLMFRSTSVLSISHLRDLLCHRAVPVVLNHLSCLYHRRGLRVQGIQDVLLVPACPEDHPGLGCPSGQYNCTTRCLDSIRRNSCGHRAWSARQLSYCADSGLESKAAAGRSPAIRTGRASKDRDARAH